MFETVAPEAFAKRSQRVFYQTLPVSLTIHALVIAGVAVTLLNQLDFPTDSPRQIRAYALVELPPPPPPPPPPPAAPKPVLQPQQVPQKLIEAAKLLAPTVIPDKIPDVKDTPPPEPVPLPPNAFDSLTKSSVGADVGIAGGIEGGLGTPPPPPPPPDDGRLHVKRGDRVPNKALRQEYPGYPEEARIRGYEDNVVVRYTIGKDGKIKDITIIDPPYRKMFADQVLHTLRDWKFTPYINESGEPEEVVHEVQFNFQLH